MVIRLLNEYWPKVAGNIDVLNGVWRVCIQPGEWIDLGKDETEIRQYLSTHPMSRDKQMDDFTKTLTDTIGIDLKKT